MTLKTALVFPGQGSQSVGMLKEYAAEFPIVQETFSIASDALHLDLWAMAQNGPVEVLNQTANTQPALLAAGVALWQVWKMKGGAQPSILAGHSLGEYTALVCAQVLDFAVAIKLVAERGKFMQEAVPVGTGTMAAIVGLEETQIREICDQAALNDVLSPANYNAIGQIVIAGHKEAVERAIPLAEKAGAKLARIIPVSVPSHCALMKPAAERLATSLAAINFSAPQIPVVNNVDVKCYTEASAIKDALIRQLYSPVRWVETIQLFAKEGITTIVECGPGKVLAGLNKRIEAGIPTTNV